MRQSNITIAHIFFWLKLAAAIVIFYIGLNYGVLPVDEQYSLLQVPSNEYRVSSTGDVVEGYIDEAVQEIQSEPGHFAAGVIDENVYQSKFESICVSDRDLCEKIDFVGSYTSKEKYLYLSSVFKVVRFIKKYTVIGDDIVDVLNTITIDNVIGNRRGYATWDEVILNLGSVQSKAEFLELIAHEMGHIVDLGALQGIGSRKHAAFTEFGRKVFATDDLSLEFYALSWKSETIRKPSMAKKDFCSGYGMTDPFEDFAECFNLYLYHHALFQEMGKYNENLKKKYTFIGNLLDQNYIQEKAGDLAYFKKDASWRPWDTTRISF